ncbi:40S ribosomal protein [Arachis hypogaea]|nr:40S ribosomal protein [Arachis hypogaea]
MRGAVLAFPDQDRSHACSVCDRPTQLYIDRKAGRQSPQGSGYVHYLSLSTLPGKGRHDEGRSLFVWLKGPTVRVLCFGGFPAATYFFASMVLQNDIDLLNPPAELEKRKHKLKRLVQSPNSFFMDVKCQGCFNITTVFSHSQTVVVCGNCQTVLCQPTGGKARLTEGCSFRKKGD